MIPPAGSLSPREFDNFVQVRITRQNDDGSIRLWSDEIPKDPFYQKSEEMAEFYNRKFFTLIASPSDPGELPPPLQRVMGILHAYNPDGMLDVFTLLTLKRRMTSRLRKSQG